MSEAVKYETYKATRVCKLCKGWCCSFYGCHYSPYDFPEISFDALKKEIEKGKISIDWWEAEPREYFLRARHIGEPVVCGSWGGICVNLTDTGCSLSWEERPLGGKALKPGKSLRDECKTSYSKETCKNEWQKHAAVLRELVAHFEYQQMCEEEKRVWL